MTFDADAAYPSTLEDVRFRIAAARRMLYRAGCDSGIAGHVSVRDPARDAFWITPFEYFDETTPDRVIKVTFDLERLEGTWEPAPVIGFHSSIYRARSDVRSIIHTHSHYVTVVSTTGRPVGMFTAPAVIFYEEQAYHVDDGTKPSVEGSVMAAALGSKSVLFMKNHGAVVVAGSLEDATVEAMTLEQCARVHVEAVAIGGTEIPVAEVLQSRESYDTYFRINTWDANMRRLRRSDPDLFLGIAGVPS